MAGTVEDRTVEKKTVTLPRQPLEDGDRFGIRGEFSDEGPRRREPAASDPVPRIGSVVGA